MQDIRGLMTNRKPNEEQGEILDAITEAIIRLGVDLDSLVPGPSRFKSLAITKLEECSMWAKKGVLFPPGSTGS